MKTERFSEATELSGMARLGLSGGTRRNLQPLILVAGLVAASTVASAALILQRLDKEAVRRSSDVSHLEGMLQSGLERLEVRFTREVEAALPQTRRRVDDLQVLALGLRGQVAVESARASLRASNDLRDRVIVKLERGQVAIWIFETRTTAKQPPEFILGLDNEEASQRASAARAVSLVIGQYGATLQTIDSAKSLLTLLTAQTLETPDAVLKDSAAGVLRSLTNMLDTLQGEAHAAKVEAEAILSRLTAR